MAYTTEQLEHLEARLLQERRRVLRKLARFGEDFLDSDKGSDGDLSAFSFHMADQGTDAMEREKAFLFASEEGRMLSAIDAALRRLYRTPSEFGMCASCGAEIGFVRLDAIPHAELCIDCKTMEETLT
ncbi:MAG: TraR/DksA C4-type zinc finger protein [Gemmatimonadetes bacterium]|nr:TraR/DksA C4-type zinc finger protein [Gemmatimonadota bacterium]